MGFQLGASIIGSTWYTFQNKTHKKYRYVYFPPLFTQNALIVWNIDIDFIYVLRVSSAPKYRSSYNVSLSTIIHVNLFIHSGHHSQWIFCPLTNSISLNYLHSLKNLNFQSKGFLFSSNFAPNAFFARKTCLHKRIVIYKHVKYYIKFI